MEELSENVKAIDVVRQMVADGQVSKDVAEKYFPELKDSEDETIRKVLIQYFSTFRLGTFAGLEPKKIIDWLEKQKEFVSADFDDVWEMADCNELTAPLEKYSKDAIKEMCHAWYDKGIELERRNWLEKQGTSAKLSEEEQNRFAKGILTSCAMSFIDYLDAHKYEGKMCVSNGECEDIENAFHNAMWDRLHRYYCKYIEKQGEKILANSTKTCKDEQKPNPYSGTSFDYDGHTWGMCARDNGVELLLDGELKAFLSLEKSFIYPIHPKPELAPKSAMEAAKEEKVDNANKVEPKFKVGDWIIFNGLTLYIKEIVKGYYRTISKGGITNSYDWGVDNTARLWTIQDAKDGDVLSNGKMIVIFKHFEEPSYRQHIVAYIGLDTNGDIQITDDTWNFGIDKVKPATKEQREQLGKAMDYAGYVFDFDKKEMMKIEDGLITGVEIPFGAKDSELEEVFYSIPNGFHAEIKDDKVVIKKGEQKHVEWSEEDKDMLRMLLEMINYASDHYQHDDKATDIKAWVLKSLKDRVGCEVNCTTTKEWSEEDNFMYNKIKNLLTDISLAPESIKSLFDWLKDLRDRVQPQTTWKPSDEQIGALEHFVRSIAESGFASPYDSNTKLVYSLFNDLKKLKL